MTDQQALFAEPEDTRPRLTSLIEAARSHRMTPEEAEAQRQSFARGNAAIDRDGERKTVPVLDGIAAIQIRLRQLSNDLWVHGAGSVKAGDPDIFNRAADMLSDWGKTQWSLDETRKQRDKLQRFKDYVHSRLDAAGVPHHPSGPHGAEGCRVGDRLDWLMGERNRMLDALRFYEDKENYDETVQMGYEMFSRMAIDRGARARTTVPVNNQDSYAAKPTSRTAVPSTGPTA